MHRSKSHQAIVYALLIFGAIIFVTPYLWMVGSSMKVDREQFSKELRIVPITPKPRTHSPYVDDVYYEDSDVSGSRRDELTPGVERLIEATNPTFPPNVDRSKALTQTAHGIIEKLKGRLPNDIWEGETDTILDRAKEIVTPQVVQDSFNLVHRFLAIGAIRVRASGVELYELKRETDPTERWAIGGDATVNPIPVEDAGKKAAKLEYDFGAGDVIRLTQTFELPFDANQLHRVQIDLHPDDTWHDVRLKVERNGRTYQSRRDQPLANFDWFTATWQHASPDDDSTKLRTWVVLDDVGPSEIDGPRTARVTFEVKQASQAEAWANKIKQNYVRTAEQIPIWRYLRVSLFLVASNIVLTMFASSLVAYAFARIEWPGRDLCFMLMLATMMIPTQVTMIPHFLIWTGVGAYDTLGPLWISAAFGNAFFIFMLRQFMAGIPRDLEDAARIDGCGFLRIYWHVILPLIKPSLAAIAVMTFVASWNDFMGPLIYIADQRLYPLAFGLYAFSVQINNNPALSMAGAVLMTLPIIAIFFAAQRYFIQGITLTGMKG